MSSFLESFVPHLEQMVADTLWAVDLKIAYTPIVLPPAGYPMLEVPAPRLFEGLPVPCEAQPVQGGAHYLVTLDAERPAETAFQLPTELVRECRGRFINLKNELFRVWPLLNHPQREFAGSVYHGGFVLGGPLGDMIRAGLTRSHEERNRAAGRDPHGVGSNAQVQFGQPLPDARRGRRR